MTGKPYLTDYGRFADNSGVDGEKRVYQELESLELSQSAG